MHSQNLRLPIGDTPLVSYERAMRHKAFYLAATVAQTYGLGRALVVHAAFAAFCRFDDLGQEEAAVEVLSRFGLTLIQGNCSELIRIMQALGELPPGDVQTGPTDIQ